jgi:SpoVK/Ycf46/Vps4 family AAA+-type ATPase
MLIGSFLGETNQRLRRLFEYVRTVPCVLLFDEFDAIAKERGDVHETGEIKRVVSSLLLQVDTLPSYVVAVAATNHDELLDRAVWRRFELRLELPSPTSQALLEFVDSKLGLIGSLNSRRRGGLLKALDRASFGDAEIFCQDVKRWCVLSLGERSVEAVIDERLQEWKSRLRARADAERPNETPSKNRRSRARGSSAQQPTKDPAAASNISNLTR